MTELFSDWVMNPYFWISLMFLGCLWVLSCWVRFKFGRKQVLGTSLGVWVVLVVVVQLIDPEGLNDARYWVSSAITTGTTTAPALLFPLAFKRDIDRVWLIAFGFACAVFGALAFPIVAIYSVCELGIDCL
jgi:hypothetical protein